MIIGSKKYPTERLKGQSCVIGPPVITPGLIKKDVPRDSQVRPGMKVVKEWTHQYRRSRSRCRSSLSLSDAVN